VVDVPETDPDLIAELAQHGEDAAREQDGEQRAEELEDDEEAIDVGFREPTDEILDIHDDVDEKLEERFKP
jgi:hypothetical protein